MKRKTTTFDPYSYNNLDPITWDVIKRAAEEDYDNRIYDRDLPSFIRWMERVGYYAETQDYYDYDQYLCELIEYYGKY